MSYNNYMQQKKYLNLEHEFAIFCGTPPRPANTTRHTWHLHGPGGSWCPVLNSGFLLSIASGCYCGSMRVLANIWRPLLIAHRTCEPDQWYVAARRSNSSAINIAQMTVKCTFSKKRADTYYYFRIPFLMVMNFKSASVINFMPSFKIGVFRYNVEYQRKLYSPVFTSELVRI